MGMDAVLSTAFRRSWITSASIVLLQVGTIVTERLLFGNSKGFGLVASDAMMVGIAAVMYLESTRAVSGNHLGLARSLWLLLLLAVLLYGYGLVQYGGGPISFRPVTAGIETAVMVLLMYFIARDFEQVEHERLQSDVPPTPRGLLLFILIAPQVSFGAIAVIATLLKF